MGRFQARWGRVFAWVLGPLGLAGAVCLVVLGTTEVRAQGIALPPLTALPATPSAPYLWFDGADSGVLAGLQQRTTHPRTAAYYATFKSYVTARLGTITTADDDTKARFAKSAAMLEVLGEAPSSGPYARYRDAAVAAIKAVGGRQAADSLADFLAPPADLINILQDAPRLQSLAEAYDLLRGSGVASADDTAVRVKIAGWANALRADWNLVGALGVAPHRDNWGIKGGAALVTTALALPDHADANAWRASGMTFLGESMSAVASTTGWFRESVWYLNYSLNGLWSTAWHVENATSVSWFASLRPMVLASLAWRQPDGRAPPFEEGITNTLPWNVMASAYPDLGNVMQWAWEQSPQRVENYDNQAAHDVTRFLLVDLGTVASAPTSSPTRTLGGDTRLFALADGWGADALQVTGMTAVDHSTSEAFDSRHNMRNPMDLMVHGGGALVMPTASGGPTVTTSGTRANYLSPLAKNIPLIAKNAPFVTAGSNVTLTVLDAMDTPDGDNHLADLARTETVGVYAAAASVARAVMLIGADGVGGGAYVAVADRFRLASAAELDLSWRGRGARTTRADTATLQGYRWSGGGRPDLDLDVVGSGGLSREDNARGYADTFGSEEAIAGVLIGSTAANASFVSVIQVGAAGASPRAVADVGSASGAAARITSADGRVEDVVVAPIGPAGPLGVAGGGGVESDGALAIARWVDDELVGFCIDGGTVLRIDGAEVLTASSPMSLCATVQPDGGLVGELGAGAGSFVLTLASIDVDAVWEVSHAGVELGQAAVAGDGLVFEGLGAGTLVVRAGSCADAATRCDDGDACTVDGCVEATGVCVHEAVVCPADARCASTVSCEPTTGACVSVDGLLEPTGGDADGLYCTVAERCDGGVFSSAARDCGAPTNACATGIECDEASRSCRDVGAPTCDVHVVYAVVRGPNGVVGSIRCTLVPSGPGGDGEVSCDTNPDGTLKVYDALVCGP